MKHMSFTTLIKLTLLLATVVMTAIFFIFLISNNVKQELAKNALLSSITAASELCDGYAERIHIDEDLRSDLDIYLADIKAEDNVIRKAYYTRIMLTYTQNRVNMNNPKTLLELSHELGTQYVTSSSEIAAYESYVEDISTAFANFESAFTAYCAAADSSIENTTTIK